MAAFTGHFGVALTLKIFAIDPFSIVPSFMLLAQSAKCIIHLKFVTAIKQRHIYQEIDNTSTRGSDMTLKSDPCQKVILVKFEQYRIVIYTHTYASGKKIDFYA